VSARGKPAARFVELRNELCAGVLFRRDGKALGRWLVGEAPAR
jgi:hypothetical protein